MPSEIYRLHPAVKGSMIQALVCSLLLALMVSALAWLAPPRAPDQVMWMRGILAVSWGASLFFYLTIPNCDAYLETTEDAISQHHPRKPTVTLRWEEVGRARNNPIMQRLELRSKTGRAKITVEHQIENYAQLTELIQSKTRLT